MEETEEQPVQEQRRGGKKGKQKTRQHQKREKLVRVAISATPGKTRHIQTCYVSTTALSGSDLSLPPHVMLCDCPGLVLPSLAVSPSDLCVNGIITSSAPGTQGCHRNIVGICNGTMEPPTVPGTSPLEIRYGLRVELEHIPERTGFAQVLGARSPHAFADAFLAAFAANRGFFSKQGVPDSGRALPLLLKDFTSGNLVWYNDPERGYCHDTI